MADNPVAARFDERYPFRDYIEAGLREGSITTAELGANRSCQWRSIPDGSSVRIP